MKSVSIKKRSRRVLVDSDMSFNSRLNLDNNKKVNVIYEDCKKGFISSQDYNMHRKSLVIRGLIKQLPGNIDNS